MKEIKKTPVVSIVSKKNSGKTTLLVKLIPELKKRGYRVGTVKHDTHGFDIDHEGKDTYRHKEAGADTVLISSPWKFSLIKDVQTEPSLDDLVEDHFKGHDIVLTEGYKREGKPQIEVFRSSAHKTPLHSRDEENTLIAVVADVPLDLGVPWFERDDLMAIADFIENTFIKQ